MYGKRREVTYQPSSPAASTQPSSPSSYPSAPSTDPPAPAAACPPIASRCSPVSGWRWRALVVAEPQARIVRLMLWEQRRRAGGWFGASWVEWRRDFLEERSIDGFGGPIEGVRVVVVVGETESG